MISLLDALGIKRAGIVGHDVGGAAMQPLARSAPGRLVGLFFFDFVYSGIGPRMAATLVGATRSSCKTYIEHFLRHWAYRKDAFDLVLDAFTDNFMQPGNLAGGFAHYRAAHPGRIAIMKGEAHFLPPIKVPTCVRWAEHDPLFPYEWTDKLGETFDHLDLAVFPGVGHFPHREDPDRAANEIANFFGSMQ